MSEVIFHLTTAPAWAAAQESKQYSAPSLETEGFIHCSAKHQVVGTANSYFKTAKEVILLEIDAKKLGSDLKWEPPVPIPGFTHKTEPDAMFPHIFAKLAIEHVVKVHPMSQIDGVYSLPADIQ